MHSIRRLVVVRHAKAEPVAPRDLDRVLTPRGRSDAAALGAWLKGEGIAPDVAFVSYAARTRETWALLADAAGWGIDPQVEGALYGADEDGVIDQVRETPEDASTVVVVGHNPAIGVLVQLLDDGDGTLESAELAIGYPTGAAAVFEVPGAWSDLAPMGARLVAFHVGRA